MITTQTFDLDAVRADEARIFEHIGRFTVEAAHIDQRLSILLAWVAGAPDRAAATRIFEGEQVSVKLRLLERALPDEWSDKNRLLKAVKAVQAYRNSLAHSTVQTLFNFDSGDVVFSKIREHRGGQRQQIDLGLLKTWEARASMLHLGLHMLTEYHCPSRNILDSDMRALIFEIMTEPAADHVAAIDFVFPPLR